MSTLGDMMSTSGVFSTSGDIMMHVGDYHEYIERCSVHGGTMSTSGDIMSTLGDVQHIGGIS